MPRTGGEGGGDGGEGSYSNSNECNLSNVILAEFESHCSTLRQAYRDRKDAVAPRNVVDDNREHEACSTEDALGKRLPSDKYEGDVNLRTLRSLLAMVDERGWER